MRRAGSVSVEPDSKQPHADTRDSDRGPNVARWSLAVSGIAVVALVVIVALGDIGVGLSEPPPLADDFRQRAIDYFEGVEEWYLRYGRWEDLAVAAAFAGLLVAVPFVKGTAWSRHALVVGAGIGVMSEVIDLSQLIGIDVARFALDNDHVADFAVGNMYRIGINHTAAFLWAAALFVTGIGMLVTARDARPGSGWQRISALFGISLIVTALADISYNTQVIEVAEYATAGLALAWIMAAYKRASVGIQAST